MIEHQAGIGFRVKNFCETVNIVRGLNEVALKHVIDIDHKKGVLFNRGGKRCEQCERCSCKDFTIGVKILVKNVIMGGVNFFLSKIVFGECYKGWCFLVFYTVSLCFTLLTCVLHLFGIGFVANRAL